MDRSWLIPVGLVGIFVACVACVCLVVFVLFGLGLWTNFRISEGLGVNLIGTPTATPQVIRPTPEGSSSVESRESGAVVSSATLETLRNTIVPMNDLRDLALRLEGKDNIPLTIVTPPGNLSIGTQKDFWVANVDTNENFQITATLEYLTDHTYFWIQDGITFDDQDLQALAETFENEIYPTNREFFGSEWTPGVDGDPHLYIVYAEGLGSNLAGYFSSADENQPLAHEYSNAHEMFLLSADNVGLNEEFAYSVLAHEFQHMIHWYRDRNESSWINEGFSELAVLLNDYKVGSDYDFIYDPDLQLNDWPNDEGATLPHYGAAFLFLTYFMDRFGDEATQALVSQPANGLESVDVVLKEIGAKDPLTGRAITADDVFLDWVLTNYLMDESVSDGRYIYHNYSDTPQAEETEIIDSCPQSEYTRDVHQYGTDYIRITCEGDYTLHFEGSILARVIPSDPYSGKYAFWSNRGDESDMILTRTFDFSDVEGPLTLTYWMWYDLEEDYDYVYVEASLDGKQWQILTTPSGTPEDPSGNSYGWGYNGVSGGWFQESVDLSKFAGHEVQIRFEYVTDAAVNGEGVFLDDIALRETGYFTDFEDDTGGWKANGWARIQNVLPQTYRLALISFGRTNTVKIISVPAESVMDIPLHLGGEGEEAILVVTGTTRYTRQKVAYRIEINP